MFLRVVRLLLERDLLTTSHWRPLQFEKHFYSHERGRVQRTGRTDGFRRDRLMSKSPRAINGNRNM